MYWGEDELRGGLHGLGQDNGADETSTEIPAWGARGGDGRHRVKGFVVDELLRGFK
jgi:hypothetical protein